MRVLSLMFDVVAVVTAIAGLLSGILWTSFSVGAF
jgi:hypothetical protein